MTSPTVSCPNCDNALPVEPLGGRRYLCPCCTREFEWEPEQLMPEVAVSGRVRALRTGRKDAPRGHG